MFENHPIKALLERWGAELLGSRWFVVGGAVRDALLGRLIQDVDVLVAGVAVDEIKAFLEGRGSVDAVGRTFGILKFVSQEYGMKLDIALPRRERSAGTGGYRDVATESDPFMPIEEDLGRRDFTANAMAWEASTDRLIDPHGGQTDIGTKILRAVGDPHLRFAEDYSRVLRCLRFAAQLDFEIEWETWKAAQALVPRLDDTRDGLRLVPYELVARELLKSFSADAVRTADLWQEAGLVKVLMAELAEWPERVRGVLERLGQDDVVRIVGSGPVSARIIFALSTAHLGAERAGRFAQRLRLSSAGFGVDETLLERLAAGGDIALYKELGLKPLLEGESIMKQLGLAPGPDVGRALNLLLDAQGKGKVSSPSEAEKWLKTHWHA